jgi:hypothetical protein
MSESPLNRPKRRWRRALLGALALGVTAGPAIVAGCGPQFDGPSMVKGLRVLAVVPERDLLDGDGEPVLDDDGNPVQTGAAYALPGDEITFTMTYVDAFDPDNPSVGARDVQIVWLGGCIDPEGDNYFGCYESLLPLFDQFGDYRPGDPFPAELEGIVGLGPKFKLAPLPDDIVTRRPVPATGPHYGIAYVFFVACAGTLGVVPLEADAGNAGSFPLGCFDAEGRRLGSESFVPGFTQIYVFADERENPNPPLEGIKIIDANLTSQLRADVLVPMDFVPLADTQAGAVAAGAIRARTCFMEPDDRKIRSCDQNVYDDCPVYTIDVDFGDDVADIDPEGTGLNGEQLRETVWIDYFASAGNFESELKLIFDSTTGVSDDTSTRWVAPQEPGIVTIWAVLHDARGGQTVLTRYLSVE